MTESQSYSRPDRPQGFTLVVTLTLLLLLVVISVGLLSLATISLRGSSQVLAAATARANARLALMIAIGDLQKHAGPDQRVTANADIGLSPATSTANLKWTGVWSTTQPADPTKSVSPANPPDATKPVVTGAADPACPDKNYLSDSRNRTTYTQKSHLLAWLVSGEPSTLVNPTTGPTDLNPVLVEKAAGLTSGGAADPNRVTAPLVKINASAAQPGGYAYWIGDESVKARIDQKATDNQPAVGAPGDGGMARLAGAEGPNIRNVKSGALRPYGSVQDSAAVERTKLITLDTVPLLTSPKDTEAAKKNFHDLTTYSESVLADVRDGGLKKDLTGYIHQTGSAVPPSIPNIPETGLPTLTGISGRPMLPGPLYADFGPNFLQLRKWYELRQKVTGSYDAGRMDPVFMQTRSSTMGRGPLPDLKSHSQSVQPFLAEARMAFDFSIDSARGNGKAIRTHVFPRVKLWNPYNVTLKAHSYLVGFPRNIRLSVTGLTKITPANPALGYYGDLKGELLYFVLEGVEIGPGECLIFSPRTSGESVKYDNANIVGNVLTPSVPAGGTQNFYFDADYQMPVSAAVPPPAYGITTVKESTPQRMYLLKDAGSPGGAMTNDAAQYSPAFPIIQKLAMDSSGDHGSNDYDNPFPNPGGTRSTGLVDSSARIGIPPLASWYLGARLRRIDENANEQPGGYTTAPGKFPITNPLISGFNIRPVIANRSNFCTIFDWVWWTVGPYINSRADQVITDASMTATMVNGRCQGSPFGPSSAYRTVKSYALFEVPRKELPPFSLASFQHAQLAYQSWQPTYIVGNSFAEGRSGYTDTAVTPAKFSRRTPVSTIYYEFQKDTDPWDVLFRTRYGAGTWHDLIQYTPGDPRELLIYDMSYMVNYVLWDRYFLSTIPHDNNGKPQWPAEPVLLPNPRMVTNPHSGMSPQKMKNLANGDFGFDYASYLLMNRGAFNINSTSVEAWRAFFSSMKDVNRPLRTGSGTITSAFSRLLLPGSSTQPDNHSSQGAWDGARRLTDAQIETMAVEMVKNVKLRGPFLGLADFVNRRLVPPTTAVPANSLTDDPTMCGPLQAAIEKALPNSPLQATVDQTDSNTHSGGWNAFRTVDRNFRPDGPAFGPWKTQGAPGYLTQADILQAAGSNITARGDTFVIRGYGEARDAAGTVTARAWCEAVVQRTPDFVAGKPLDTPSDATGNNPMEPMVIRSTTEFSATANPRMLDINKRFGRRFVITDFRWLSIDEV